MANEAIQRVRFSDPVDFTVADGTAIPKGSVLQLTDARTASLSSADNEIFCGIAARDKIANDGRTQLSVFVDGIFDVTLGAAGATAVGHRVNITGANVFGPANVTTAADFAEHAGKLLEAGANDEVVQLMIGRAL
jgi:hypothetical protein